MKQVIFKKQWNAYYPGANPKLDDDLANRLIQLGLCTPVKEQEVAGVDEPTPEPAKEVTDAADDSQQQDGTTAGEPERSESTPKTRGRRT